LLLSFEPLSHKIKADDRNWKKISVRKCVWVEGDFFQFSCECGWGIVDKIVRVKMLSLSNEI
jgi:hypothetical protein